MNKESLKKKTVAELKEMAKKLPGVKGLSSMKKDELIELVAGAAGQGAGTGEAPAAEAAPPTAEAAAAGTPVTAGPLDRSGLKQRIRALKQEKREALERRDHARSAECTRMIHRYKRMLRKLARAEQPAAAK